MKMKEQKTRDETIDSIGPFRITQGKNGYRFSEDTILLAEFAAPLSANDTVLDIGTGSAIIPLILTYKTCVKNIVGIELQSGLAKLAIKNVRFNNLSEKIKILKSDFRELKKVFKDGSFSVVISNPPYTKTGSGRFCSDSERTVARHEIYGTLQELVHISKYLLQHDGRIFYIYPTARLKDVVSALTVEGLEIARIKFTDKGRCLKCFLVEARKR